MLARKTPPNSSATVVRVQGDTDVGDPSASQVRTCSTAAMASCSRLPAPKKAGLQNFWPVRGTGVGRACSVPRALRWKEYGFCSYHCAA